MNRKKILLIGGGSGGHIMPLRNLADALLAKGCTVEMILSDADLDRRMAAENFSDVPVHFFRTGKIRRYFSRENFRDFLRILSSGFKAKKLLKDIKPDVIFFKGGFVGFPFLVAIKFIGLFSGKIYSHESDISPGALTRMLSRYADQVFSNFGDQPMPLFYQPLDKQALRDGNHHSKKILILGGSLGAEFLNQLFQKHAHALCKKYKITLVSGIGKKLNFQHKNFEQFEILPVENLAQKISEAHVVISRAGSNSLAEIISAKKKCMAIPLPSSARNHQFLNAKFYEVKGLCYILEQNEETTQNFIPMLEKLIKDESIMKSLYEFNLKNASQEIAEIICKR